MLIWKIYFFFIAIISLPLYLLGALMRAPGFVIDLAFFVVLMVGFFGLVWRKQIISNQFWKIFFPIVVIWNLGFACYSFEGISTVILNAIYLPTLVPIFLYAFKSDDIWNQNLR